MSSVTPLLKEMSHAEKLCAMEELWDELCRSREGVPSPDWHGEVLAGRAARVREGVAEFREWDDVKSRLLHPRG
jgi:Putative addiction module component